MQGHHRQGYTDLILRFQDLAVFGHTGIPNSLLRTCALCIGPSVGSHLTGVLSRARLHSFPMESCISKL